MNEHPTTPQASRKSKWPWFALAIVVVVSLCGVLVVNAVREAREAALRNSSICHMKQLALAMLNYHDKHGRYPPPVIVGEDGKTLHSWRVAVLPYLEEAPLFAEYRLDEPWDSEHNRRLIDKMPSVFRDPHAPQGSTSSSYYMVTGRGTFGDTTTGRRDDEISDGTSKTIMVVDAQRDFPWTKPEDIEIDPDPAAPLPPIGGHLQHFDLFLAACADGHVATLPLNIDPSYLRALSSVAGGEPVDEP